MDETHDEKSKKVKAKKYKDLRELVDPFGHQEANDDQEDDGPWFRHCHGSPPALSVSENKGCDQQPESSRIENRFSFDFQYML